MPRMQRAMKRATLQYITHFSADDFGLGQDEYEQLVVAESLGLVVTVDCLAVDNGGYGYWDITLPCGLEINAIDGYHLEQCS